jgi:hypothetical protein
MLLATLGKSQRNIQHPASWKGLADPLLRTAGVRSFDSFAHGSKAVDVTVEDGSAILVPTKNGGPGNAFLHLEDKAIRVRLVDGDFAEAIRAALAACNPNDP